MFCNMFFIGGPSCNLYPHRPPWLLGSSGPFKEKGSTYMKTILLMSGSISHIVIDTWDPQDMDPKSGWVRVTISKTIDTCENLNFLV